MERGALAAMGTRFEIIAAGASAPHARAAIESALAEIRECHRLWSPFSSDSIVAHLHRSDLCEVPVDGLTYELLKICRKIHDLSAGAFSPCTGSVLATRDPRRVSTEESFMQVPLSGADLVSDFEVLENPPRVRWAGQNLRWDFGAVAKGFALDLALESLKESGIEQAFLHGGSSSVTALGSARGSQGWQVKIPNGESLYLKSGQSLAVSTSQGRYDGDHLVDPKRGDWVSATTEGCWVRMESAAEADAWATALLVSRQWGASFVAPGVEGQDWGWFLPQADLLKESSIQGTVGVDFPG